MVPLYVIEEHHEAFLAWHHAATNGLIPAQGNTLFHVDEHSDMGVPRFNQSIHELNGSFAEYRRFTYSELNIGGFIVPLVYQELIDNVYWIKQSHRSKVHSERLYVRSYNQAGKKLIMGKMRDLEKTGPDPDRKEFGYFLNTIDQVPVGQTVILDIDLDYFSCSGNPNEIEEIKIEISREEFDRFNANKYHRLRYSGVGKIRAASEESRYYFIFNEYRELYPSPVKVDKDIIVERIEGFIRALREKKVNPRLIDICRSHHSGYTPGDQWEFIEEQLMSRLSAIYDLIMMDAQAICNG